MSLFVKNQNRLKEVIENIGVDNWRLTYGINKNIA